MKKRFVLIIFGSSVIGLLATIIHGVFFEEETIKIINGVNLFKYFTLQSNLIVAIYFLVYFNGRYKDNKLFNKMLGGVVIYITITFIVYFFLLEPLLSPKGFNLIGSIFNHYITPLLVIGFIFHYREDYIFTYKDSKTWIIYPIAYLEFLIIYGVVTNDYIYPFFQVGKIGIIGLLISVIINTLLFLLMSFSLVKMVSKK